MVTKKGICHNLSELLMAIVSVAPLATTQCNNQYREESQAKLERRIKELETQELEKTRNEEYSFERFKKALGTRYDPLNEGVFEWHKASAHDKRMYCLVYENPKTIISEFEEKEREEYKNFDPYNLPVRKLVEYERIIPWHLLPINRTPTESDKLMIYMTDSFQSKLKEKESREKKTD